MDSIVLRNKKFVKASVLAKELGYTSDYIGQLCRAGKIEAQLVGRTWFVADAALREHKVTRYRSTAKTTKRSLQSMVLGGAQPQEPTVGYKALKVHYEKDESALIPKPLKTDTKAGVEQVVVHSSDNSQNVRIKDLTSEPKTGPLKVRAATEEPTADEVPFEIIASPERIKHTIDKTIQPSNDDQSPTHPLPAAGDVLKKTGSIVEKVPVKTGNRAQQKKAAKHRGVFLVAVALLLSVLLSALNIVTVWKVNYQEGTTRQGTSLDVQNSINTLKNNNFSF